MRRSTTAAKGQLESSPGLPIDSEKRCGDEFARICDFQERQSSGGIFHCWQRTIAARTGNAGGRAWHFQRRSLRRLFVATGAAGALCKFTPVSASERDIAESRSGRRAEFCLGGDGDR